jgi:hypothetical protein
MPRQVVCEGQVLSQDWQLSASQLIYMLALTQAVFVDGAEFSSSMLEMSHLSLPVARLP